jgi:NitT/TauT family transport system substrate-binding protein
MIAQEIRLVDEQFVLKTLAVSPKYCAAISDEFAGSTMRLVPVLRELGYLGADLGEAEIFDYNLIRKVHPEPAHY